jgi:hypothetical protein
MREGKLVKRTMGWMVVALLVVTGLSAAAQIPMTVLDIDPGVAELGAGGAGLSIVNGAETLHYNPAGLAHLPGVSFSSFYASHFGLGAYSAFTLAFPHFGFGVLFMNSGSIQGYSEGGEPSETLAFGNTAFVFGAGLMPSDLPFLPEIGFSLSLGARIRVVTARIGEERGSGFTFDLGSRSVLGSFSLGPVSISDLTVAVNVVNVFGSISYDDVQESFPMDIELGASAVVLDLVRASVDVHLTGGLHVGLAYAAAPTFTIRLGAILRDGFSLTAGVGVNVEGFQVDYAFVSHTLGGSHRVSLTLDFSALDIRALTSSLRRLLP